MTNQNFNKKVGDNIRKQRELKNLSQGALAKILKVTPSYISTLESGVRNPSVKTLEKIASALGLDASVLLEVSSYDMESLNQKMPVISGLVSRKEKNWIGRKWYHQRFDGAPYLIHMIAEAEITTRRREKYGLFFDHHFCFFDEGKADWYIDLHEIDRISGDMLKLSKTYPQFSKKLMKEYEPLDHDFYEACKKIGIANLHGLTNHDLIELHDEFVNKVLARNSSSSIIDGFALGTDRMLEEKIRKAYDSDKMVAGRNSFAEVFSAVTSPSHSSFVRDSELDLFKVILEIQKGGDKKKLIKEYRDKYFWVRNNYVDANVLSVNYFEEEIARIQSSGLDVGAEVKRIQDLPLENKKRKEALMNELDFDQDTLFLLQVTEDFTQWQDERKKATMFTAHYCTLLLDEISRRVNISTDLLKYMSPREVSRIFVDTPPVELLEARRKNSVVYWDEEGHEILTGPEVEAIRRKLLGNNSHDDVQDFRGMTAALGKAEGRVRILKSAKEIQNIKKGEVLVTVMTRPDYVPAMKLASAIITDEGGITSHAAIVSRELKIPCVIGTKIATQVLHDGDLVQVNANHGLVKILKRAGE